MAKVAAGEGETAWLPPSLLPQGPHAPWPGLWESHSQHRADPHALSHPLGSSLSSTLDGQSLPSCPLGLWDSRSLPLALASREKVCVTRAGLG